MALVAKTVAFPRKQILKLEALTRAKVRQSPALAARVGRLEEVRGFGALTAISLVALMPGPGTLSDTRAAALAGVASFNRDSGQFRGQRHIAGGRRQVRSALYMAALVASRPATPSSKPFTSARWSAARPRKLALTALMRKLIILANTLLKNPDFVLAS